MTNDDEYGSWSVGELEGLRRARLRALLILESRDGPLALRRGQEALCRQAWRLLRARGVETAPVQTGP